MNTKKKVLKTTSTMSMKLQSSPEPRRRFTSKEFKGGKLTSIFGGTDLNLVNADLAWGTNILDVFVLFGGCEYKSSF